MEDAVEAGEVRTIGISNFLEDNEDMETIKHIYHIKDYGKHSIFPVFGGKLT